MTGKVIRGWPGGVDVSGFVLISLPSTLKSNGLANMERRNFKKNMEDITLRIFFVMEQKTSLNLTQTEKSILFSMI